MLATSSPSDRAGPFFCRAERHSEARHRPSNRTSVSRRRGSKHGASSCNEDLLPSCGLPPGSLPLAQNLSSEEGSPESDSLGSHVVFGGNFTPTKPTEPSFATHTGFVPTWEVGKVNLSPDVILPADVRALLTACPSRLAQRPLQGIQSSAPGFLRQPGGHNPALSRLRQGRSPSSLEESPASRDPAAGSGTEHARLSALLSEDACCPAEPPLYPGQDVGHRHSPPQEAQGVGHASGISTSGSMPKGRGWMQKRQDQLNGIWGFLHRQHPTGTQNQSITHNATKEEEKEDLSSAFRLRLSCAQSTVLLNFLAFGYAATAVMVKAMEGGGAEAVAATTSAGLTEAAAAATGFAEAAGVAAGSAAGGCLSLTTSAEFAVRFASAAAASAALMWMTRRGSPRQPQFAGAGARQGAVTETPGRSAWGAGLDLGFWMFVTYAGQAVGLQTASAHDAALILTASVVLVPLLEAMEGSKLHWSLWLATALACSGLLLLEGGTAEAATQAAGLVSSQSAPLGMSQSGLGIPAGHLWCFLGAIGSAVHVVRSERHCAEHSPLELVTLQLGTTAALGALWLGFSLAHASGLDGSGLGALVSAPSCLGNACAALPLGMLLLAGPLGTGICEWLELEALQYVKASTATLILTASPLWASLLAYLTLGETMTTSTILGAALILSASLQVQLLSPCKEDQ